MNIGDDEKLTVIVHQVDQMLSELITTANIGILPLSAVILARIVLANDDVGLSDDIRKLLVEASSYPPKKDIPLQ